MQLLDVIVPVLDASVDPEALAIRRLGDGLTRTQGLNPAVRLRALIDAGLDRLPLPGQGRTLHRWRLLARVGAEDLALAKLFEAHTDALAILAELDPAGTAVGMPRPAAPTRPASAARAAAVAPVLTEVVMALERPGDTQATVHPIHLRPAYGVWGTEGQDGRVEATPDADGRVLLQGRKTWCAGAADVQRGLLTVWMPDGSGPWLADVDLHQPGVTRDDSAWAAVGMAGAAAAELHFDRVPARLVGWAGAYTDRPGFWHGGAGLAACWHGALGALAQTLRVAVHRGEEDAWHLLLAMGQVDGLLSANAALLREAAAWIDHHPQNDARGWTLRVRTATDDTAQQVIRVVTRALGPGPLCRHAGLARLLADLPVFLRQSHGDRDLATLGELAASADTEEAGGPPWRL